MPYKIDKWGCRICHRQFDSEELAKAHEYTCSECIFCKHAYYIYGCEFACKNEEKCGYHNGYKYFERKTVDD